MPPAISRRLLCLAALLLAALATSTRAATPPACGLYWELSLPATGGEATVDVTLSLDAGPRSRIELQLPEGSEIGLLAEPGAPTLEPVPGRPLLRSLALRPGERTQLRFRLRPGPGAWWQAGPGRLMFHAGALLPQPSEIGPWQMCLGLADAPPEAVLLANQGQAGGAEPLLRLQGSTTLLREWLVVAGRPAALLQTPREAEGQALRLLVPADPAPETAARQATDLADAAARQAALLRRHWADGPAPEQWLLAWTVPADAPARGLAVHGGLLLQLPAGLEAGARDHLLLQTLLQGWLRERFGPVAYEPRADEAMTAWFSRGFASFYAQRLRSAGGQQSLAAHAEALSALLSHNVPGAQGPWLAMHWHTELRQRGRPGLDALLKPLRVPAEQARVSGPWSAPLAPHRLQAALRDVLPDAPPQDVQRLASLAPPTNLTAEVLGPCFRFDAANRRVLPATDGEPDAACRSWLEGTPPAAAAGAAATAKPAGKAAKPAKTSKAAKSGARPAKKTGGGPPKR
jgi:hypothetical protein